MKRRDVHHNAIDFLRLHERSGLLEHFGGAAGVIDLADAADFLARVLEGLTMIFALVGKPEPEPVFYICAGANFCIGSGVKREPRTCPNCGVECVAVDRWGKEIGATS